MVKQITQKEFNEVINSDEPVLVDFFANWCGPCRMLSPIMEEISEDVKVFKINIDEEDQLATKYDVMSIPCIVCFKNGIEIGRSVGYKPKEDILDLIK